MDDLLMEQNGNHLEIDLPGHGGGTLTLQNTDEAALTNEIFMFFSDDAAVMA